MAELSDQQKVVKTEIESGHCEKTSAILDSLPSFEERVRFLNAIEEKNREETEADKNLPLINFGAQGNRHWASVDIFRKEHASDWTGGIIYKATTHLDNNEQSTACVDFPTILKK